MISTTNRFPSQKNLKTPFLHPKQRLQRVPKRIRASEKTNRQWLEEKIRTILGNHFGEVVKGRTIRSLIGQLQKQTSEEEVRTLLQTVNPKHLLGAEKLHAKGITGKGVRIKIIDLYFDYPDHPDFQGRKIHMPRTYGQGKDAHGTSVASVIIGHASKGVAPGAEITAHLIKEINNPANEIHQYTEAIEDEISSAKKSKKHCRIICLSLGFFPWKKIIWDGPAFHTHLSESQLERYYEAIEEFHNTVKTAFENGIMVVRSAAGSGMIADFIGRIDSQLAEDKEDFGKLSPELGSPHLLVVGSAVQVDPSGVHRPAHYTPYGGAKRGVDFLAPSDCLVAVRNSYDLQGGTSFAAPFAAGVLALMLESNPSLTSSQAFEILKRTCSPLDIPDFIQDRHDLHPFLKIGDGLIDPLNAVKNV